MFTIKSDGKGNILKHKANLVAREYFHAIGIDYDDSASPMTMLETVRFVLAVEAGLCSKMQQMDIELAFLNADLGETEFIWSPDGLAYRLKKCLKYFS